MAEMEGFEPPHALRRLPDFESGPFNHLGTPPFIENRSPDLQPAYSLFGKTVSILLAFCVFFTFSKFRNPLRHKDLLFFTVPS